MSRLWFVLMLLCCGTFVRAQLNVGLLHQLVAQSQSEHGKQSDARDRQAENSANEEVNKTLMSRLKDKYRDIQSRFKVLGLAIDGAQIGIDAYPIVSEIARNQVRIFELCKDDPVLSVLAIQTEMELVDKSESLISFIYGLCLSAGELNQMKPSDRKLLFGHVLTELRRIAGTSRGLVSVLTYQSKRKALNALNPFADFINTDKKMVDNILERLRHLK